MAPPNTQAQMFNTLREYVDFRQQLTLAGIYTNMGIYSVPFMLRVEVDRAREMLDATCYRMSGFQVQSSSPCSARTDADT